MQFMFKQIDEDYPDAEYSVTVALDKSQDKYKGVYNPNPVLLRGFLCDMSTDVIAIRGFPQGQNCEPMIPNFDELCAELDREGKLEPFLRKVRKGFQQRVR